MFPLTTFMSSLSAVLPVSVIAHLGNIHLTDLKSRLLVCFTAISWPSERWISVDSFSFPWGKMQICDKFFCSTSLPKLGLLLLLSCASALCVLRTDPSIFSVSTCGCSTPWMRLLWMLFLLHAYVICLSFYETIARSVPGHPPYTCSWPRVLCLGV